jgi:hypothetical protein
MKAFSDFLDCASKAGGGSQASLRLRDGSNLGAWCCALRAESDKTAQCKCWNSFKPTYDKMAADPVMGPALAPGKAQIDALTKACDGFATSPSFLFVAAAALSMTLFTMRNPLE